MTRDTGKSLREVELEELNKTLKENEVEER